MYKRRWGAQFISVRNENNETLLRKKIGILPRTAPESPDNQYHFKCGRDSLNTSFVTSHWRADD